MAGKKSLDAQADDRDQAGRARREHVEITSWLQRAEEALKVRRPRSPAQIANSAKMGPIAGEARRVQAAAERAKRERGIMPPAAPTSRSVVRIAESAPRLGVEKRSKTDGDVRVNLRAVAEVCIAAGLNPAEKIVEALEGNELDAALKARVNLELLSYLQPKLKAVEVRVEDNRDLSEEQIDERIDSLLQKLEARKRV